MARERWEDVVAYYRTYLSLVQSLIKESKTMIIKLEPSQIMEEGVLQELLDNHSPHHIYLILKL